MYRQNHLSFKYLTHTFSLVSSISVCKVLTYILSYHNCLLLSFSKNILLKTVVRQWHSCPGRWCSHRPWRCSRAVEMQHWGMWSVGMVELGWWLDWMILEVFSIESWILWFYEMKMCCLHILESSAFSGSVVNLLSLLPGHILVIVVGLVQTALNRHSLSPICCISLGPRT